MMLKVGWWFVNCQMCKFPRTRDSRIHKYTNHHHRTGHMFPAWMNGLVYREIDRKNRKPHISWENPWFLVSVRFPLEPIHIDPSDAHTKLDDVLPGVSFDTVEDQLRDQVLDLHVTAGAFAAVKLNGQVITWGGHRQRGEPLGKPLGKPCWICFSQGKWGISAGWDGILDWWL